MIEASSDVTLAELLFSFAGTLVIVLPWLTVTVLTMYTDDLSDALEPERLP
jgi:hypothetical protein